MRIPILPYIAEIRMANGPAAIVGGVIVLGLGAYGLDKYIDHKLVKSSSKSEGPTVVSTPPRKEQYVPDFFDLGADDPTGEEKLRLDNRTYAGHELDLTIVPRLDADPYLHRLVSEEEAKFYTKAIQAATVAHLGTAAINKNKEDGVYRLEAEKTVGVGPLGLKIIGKAQQAFLEAIPILADGKIISPDGIFNEFYLEIRRKDAYRNLRRNIAKTGQQEAPVMFKDLDFDGVYDTFVVDDMAYINLVLPQQYERNKSAKGTRRVFKQGESLPFFAETPAGAKLGQLVGAGRRESEDEVTKTLEKIDYMFSAMDEESLKRVSKGAEAIAGKHLLSLSKLKGYIENKWELKRERLERIRRDRGSSGSIKNKKQ